MTWLWQSKISKSHFYVCREADGVRGSAVVFPAMRQLLRDSFRKTPTKATVQVSSKGLKLTQSVPSMSRSGKVKMQLVKFQIAANCITYSVTGKAPFDDVVGVVMLVLNPEMQSPMHVHCYRCDSSETASILHANLQTQRAILDLEQRLFLSGLLVPRPPPRRPAPALSTSSLVESSSQREERLPKRVVDELKNKLNSNGDLRKTGRDYPALTSITKRLSMAELNRVGDSQLLHQELSNPMSRFRLFGDTLVKKGRSRSMDNLSENRVSTDQHGGLGEPRRFPRHELTDPFGHSYERAANVEAFWKSPRRSSSIKLNLL